MSRLKAFARFLRVPALLLGIAGMLVPAQAAVNVQVAIAGSSAMWQNSALAAYNGGNCVDNSGGCKHYTGKGFNLTDTRPVPPNNDAGNIWIVWNATKVWIYISVDSVVGDRCFLAQPQCLIEAPNPFPAFASLISLNFWGADVNPPAAVQALLQAPFPTSVNVAATDIRPEDAFYALCRANSTNDAGVQKKGLGYGTTPFNPNPVNVGFINCPANVAAGGNTGPLVGTPIISAVSSSQANVLAFNISGKDPFPPNIAISPYTVVSVGAAPIVFLTRRNHNPGLQPILGATDQQLQCIYTQNGGPKPNSMCFGQNPGAALDVYQREPLSGTMNTTEFSVFRNDKFLAQNSQEDGVTPPLVPPVAPFNPLAQNILNQNCGTANTGAGRFRVIGTGEMVGQIFASTAGKNGAITADPACDAIGYAFFSFGNVQKLAAGGKSYGYLFLDGLDPIGPGPLIPLGPPAQQLPNGNSLPPATTCPLIGGVPQLPCNEFQLWGNNVFSFPSLRAPGGVVAPYSINTYRAWSVLRFVAYVGNAAVLANAKALATGAQQAAVCTVPDFVPAAPTNATCGINDPGLKNWHAHYNLQYAIAGVNAPVAVVNNGICIAANEKGRDVGGCTIQRACPAGDAIHLGQEYTDLTAANPLGSCKAPLFP